MKQISIKEYCKIVGVSQPAISYRIKKGRPLPGIKNYWKENGVGSYILLYDGSMNRENAKASFVSRSK